MKKPVAPKIPAKPYQPTEPQRTRQSNNWSSLDTIHLPSYKFYSLPTLSELLQPVATKLGVDLTSLQFKFRAEEEYYRDERPTRIDVYYEGQINNPHYEVQFLKYLKDLAKYEKELNEYPAKEDQYKADLKEYNQKFKEWQLEDAKATVKKLEKELG